MTPASLKILRAIDELTRQHGFPPSFEEIADAVGLSSLATVSKHVTNLELAGMLAKLPMIARTLTLTAKGRKQLIPDGDLELLREALWYIELAAADHDSIGDTDGAEKAGELASRIRKRIGVSALPPIAINSKLTQSVVVKQKDIDAAFPSGVQRRMKYENVR